MTRAQRWIERITATPQPGQAPASTGEGVYFISPSGDDTAAGTFAQPWASVNHAAATLRAGETVLIRGGTYRLSERVEVRQRGAADAWITFAAYPGEVPILDADAVEVGPPGSESPWPHDQGAFIIWGAEYIRVSGLKIVNSHNSGFTVRDSSYIDLINNTTQNSFSPGIAIWDTDHDGENCHHHRVLGNTIIRSNTWAMAPSWSTREGEPPHEAISIAGSQHFEVAYNHITQCEKEGIDVKETSRYGRVHHNYIHDCDRQGLYVDSWFGVLEDVELHHNVIHNCRGAGIVLSVEGGQLARDIRIHHNLVFDNRGTGILFGRWGGDGPRRNIHITHNTVVHNGYGPASAGTAFHWITGGLFLFSSNLEDIEIRDNIFSENAAFQIGCSERYGSSETDIVDTLRQKRITITHNLVHQTASVVYPVHVGWPDNYADVRAIDGTDVVRGDPRFAAPQDGDFTLLNASPATGMGAFPADSAPDFW